MDLFFDDDAEQFRAEVRSWLVDHVPDQPLPSMDTAEGFEAHRAWERTMAADPSLQMWLTFGVIALALVLYMQERLALELTSLGVICALIVLFQILPLPGPASSC